MDANIPNLKKTGGKQAESLFSTQSTDTKDRLDSWTETTLGEVAKKIAMGPFGSNIKVETFVSEGIPVISGTHLSGLKVEDKDYNFITREHAERLRSANVFRGDIIFTHAGNIGQVAYIPEDSQYERYVLSQRQFYLRPDTDKLSPAYLTYYFKTREGQHKLLANANQTGVPSIAQPASYLKSITIHLPSLQEQQAIVAILSSLDDKIELLREQNKTLEATAQTIFKEWFVNFNFPGATDKMVDTELGQIPEGWKVGKFTNLADVLGGGTPDTTVSEYWGGNIPFFTPKDALGTYCMATEKTITNEGLKSCNSQLYPKNTVFITARGTVGKCVLSSSNMAMNQSCYALVGKDISNLFVYLLAKHLINSIQKVASGGVFDAITTATFESMEVIVPHEGITDKFSTVVSPIFEKIFRNGSQIQNLSFIRNTLLPRLMNGKLRINV